VALFSPSCWVLSQLRSCWAYLDAAGLWDEKKAPLFQSIKHGKATGNRLAQADVYRMIRRRALAAGLGVDVCCHTWRATGITAYLLNGGALETGIGEQRNRKLP
jgi:integrase/recombinase XerD